MGSSVSRKVGGALAAFLFFLPIAVQADGFGWHGISFRYEGLETFGGKRASEAEVARLQGEFRRCIYGQRDGDVVDRSVRVLGEMLRTGWRSAPRTDLSYDQWAAFSDLDVCPTVLPELSFGKTAHMVAPQVFGSVLDASPRDAYQVLPLFLNFGRAFGATHGFERCRDALPEYGLELDAPLSWCSPVYFILTPSEVRQLAVEWQRGLDHVPPLDRPYVAEFTALVNEAAAKKRALFFSGFD